MMRYLTLGSALTLVALRLAPRPGMPLALLALGSATFF